MNVKATMQNFARKRGYDLRNSDYVPQSYERKIYEYYLKKPENIHTIFDVGANIGQTALGFQESYPEALIYSFEPFVKAFQRLVENTSPFSTVHCLNMALGDLNTTMTVASESEDNLLVNSLLDSKQEEMKKQGSLQLETVTVRTGESFCVENRIEKIDVLKIDTEGYEIPVLNGFGEFLRHGVRSILSEFCLLENKSNQTPLMRLYDLLHPIGYELVSLYDIRHEADGAFHYGNALFVHGDHLQTDRRW